MASAGLAPSAAGDGGGDSRTFSEWAFVWRRPARADRAIGIDPLRLMVIAALTSAAVSLLTVWASDRTQVAVPGNEWVPVVTVSYEPLEPASRSQPVAGAGSPAAFTELANAEARAVDNEAAGGGKAEPLATARETAPRGTTGTAPSGFAVTSQPEGAHVTVNGVGYGVTPLTIRFLPPGAKRVRATKPGYQSEERFLGPEAAGSATRLRIVLRENPGGRGGPQ